MAMQLVTRDLKRVTLDGSFVDRDHPNYDRMRRVWNGMIDRHPAAIVLARDADDVAKVVQIAAEHGVMLAVRCGGHSFPGFSTCDGGILLDLSLIKHITVDPAARCADVGGGALLGDLDLAGAPYGLVTPAGVVSHTGVGGLTLGGGMGWLSRRFGLTVDNLLGAEIVTAEGRLIRTSIDERRDLFWAICGGGGNFGVVTRFRFAMHPLGPVVVGQWAYPFCEAVSALRRYRDSMTKAPREMTVAFFLTRGDLRVKALWSGSAIPSASAFERLGKLGSPSAASIGGLTFLELQKALDEDSSWGRRYYAKGGFLRDMDESTIGVLAESMADAPTDSAEIYILQLGGAIEDRDEMETPYTGRAAPFYWIVQPAWDSPTDDQACVAWARKTAARLEAVSMRGNYVNEQSETGLAAGAYGEEKFRRLAEIKGRYDPANVFRLNQNIEPRISG
jgi:FAD/FMN-containing dehydrogenase